jgi:hypothetical protein
LRCKVHWAGYREELDTWEPAIYDGKRYVPAGHILDYFKQPGNASKDLVVVRDGRETVYREGKMIEDKEAS